MAGAGAEDDSSARRYARLLVSEIKLYNEAAVRTGREKRDLLNRLAPEIERAQTTLRRARVAVGRRAGDVLSAGTRAHARGRRLGAPRRQRYEHTSRTRDVSRAATICLRPPGALLAAFVSASAPSSGQLVATAHPPLPATASDMWLVPSETPRLARAATLYRAARRCRHRARCGSTTTARCLLRADPPSPAARLPTTPRYYKGLAQLRLDRAADARATFDALQERKPTGYLAIATSLGEAEAAAALGDHADALAIYETADVGQDRGQRADSRAGRRRRHESSAIAARPQRACCGSTTSFRSPTRRSPPPPSSSRCATSPFGRATSSISAGRSSCTGRAAIRMRAPPLPPCRARSAATIASSSISASRSATTSCSGYAGRARRLQPWLDRGVAAGRGTFLPGSARSAVSVATRRFSRRRSALVRDFPVELVVRRGAQQPRAPTTSSRTTTRMAAQAFDRALSRSSPGASAPSGRRGSRDGGPTRTPSTPRNGPRVREGRGRSFPRSDYRPCSCTGRRVRTRKLGAGGDAQSRLRLVVTDYGNSYDGRLAGRHLSRSAQTTLVADAVPAARQVSRRRPADPANAGRHPAASRQRALRRRVERAALRAAKQSGRRRSSTRRLHGRITGRESCAGPSR